MSVGISGKHPVPQACTCGDSRMDGTRQAAGTWEAGLSFHRFEGEGDGAPPAHAALGSLLTSEL